MVIKREAHRVVVKPEAEERIRLNQCPACGKPKAEWTRRQDWRCCSNECTTKYWGEYVIANGWEDLRTKCFKRDKYTCVKCGFKPVLYFYKYQYIKWDNYTEERVSADPPIMQEGVALIENRLATEEDWRYPKAASSFFIGDHIKPIAIGGEQWNPDNIQTLCINCNKVKTAKDAADIALARLVEKYKAKGQVQLV